MGFSSFVSHAFGRTDSFTFALLIDLFRNVFDILFGFERTFMLLFFLLPWSCRGLINLFPYWLGYYMQILSFRILTYPSCLNIPNEIL